MWIRKHYLKQLVAVFIVFALGIVVLFWANSEATNSLVSKSVLAFGILLGVTMVVTLIIVKLANGMLFPKNKEDIEANKIKSAKQAKLLLVPGMVFGVTFQYFPATVKVFILGMMAGYIIPSSVVLILHFTKNHKYIEKVYKES